MLNTGIKPSLSVKREKARPDRPQASLSLVSGHDSKALGQYFTPSSIVKTMVSMIGKPKNASVLEPSAGQGAFLRELRRQNFKNLCAVEIDPRLPNLSDVSITYDNFLTWRTRQTYDVIIGNPPYVRWKNIPAKLREGLRTAQCNSLMDLLHAFIYKSLDILSDDGELIFITPDYWMRTMHAGELRNRFLSHGHFEQIIRYGEQPVFQKIASSILIFKFVKNHHKCRITVKDLERSHQYKTGQFRPNTAWSLLPDSTRRRVDSIKAACGGHTLGEVAQIGNGMVSGLDRAFKLNSTRNLSPMERKRAIKVIKAFQLEKYTHHGHTYYIQLNSDDSMRDYPNFYTQLHPLKPHLEKRYKYANDPKWFEWSFLRNYSMMKSKQEKIMVPCKERINKKQFVRFSYARGDYFASQDVTAIAMLPHIKESIKYVLAILNSSITYEWIEAMGLRRGGVVEFSERPLTEIPIKRIDWGDRREVGCHNRIVKQVDLILRGGRDFEGVEDAVASLYGIKPQ